MISQQYTKGQSFVQHAQQVLYETGESVIKQQHGILRTYYNRRTGATERALSSRPFSVLSSSSGVKLIINYPAAVRFLDLRKTKTGKRKKLYQPIYNKPLYGYIYGYAYNALRYGMAENIRSRVTDPLKIVFKQPIVV